MSPERIRAVMREAAVDDVAWRERLAVGTVYDAGDDVVDVAKDAYLQFFSTNALYPNSFPSVRRFEQEIIDRAAGLLNGPDATGSVTSGGSESILMAVKSARDRARVRHPEITDPEMVVPVSAHPAFWKAAHYFGVRPVKTPLHPETHLLDLDSYLGAVTDSTVLMVGSAPSLTLGMVDPIPEMALPAAERDINFHVDSCVGGYFLPFAERLGSQFPTFDFRVPGVSTISADLHKFGYTAKGASTLISRDEETFAHQVFRFGEPERTHDWYVTPSMTGTRPGAAIAAAWAVMSYLGEDGYLRVVRETLRHVRAFQTGINAIDGLRVMGEPVMTVFAYTSDTLDMFAVADGMHDRGWQVARDTWPVPTIRFMQSLGHAPYFASYLEDLQAVAAQVRDGELVSGGGTANYT
jgi:glutamate/tyrosine decarboxylase-like PLP-dependent enzyme